MRAVLPRFVDLAARYGSLTRGVLAERKAARREAAGAPLFRTLKGGLGQLTSAAEEAAASHMQRVTGRAEALERTPGGFRLRVNGAWLETEHLVLACEAHAAAPLAAGVDARLGELLGGVAYSSSMTVALGFDESAFPKPLEGFGFLIPKRERRRLIACTWVGTKFPHRVPPGTALLRCFLGGMEDAAVLEESDDKVIAAVAEELQRIVPFTARPPLCARVPLAEIDGAIHRGAPRANGRSGGAAGGATGAARGRQRLPGHRRARLRADGESGGGADSRKLGDGRWGMGDGVD